MDLPAATIVVLVFRSSAAPGNKGRLWRQSMTRLPYGLFGFHLACSCICPPARIPSTNMSIGPRVDALMAHFGRFRLCGEVTVGRRADEIQKQFEFRYNNRSATMASKIPPAPSPSLKATGWQAPHLSAA